MQNISIYRDRQSIFRFIGMVILMLGLASIYLRLQAQDQCYSGESGGTYNELIFYFSIPERLQGYSPDSWEVRSDIAFEVFHKDWRNDREDQIVIHVDRFEGELHYVRLNANPRLCLNGECISTHLRWWDGHDYIIFEPIDAQYQHLTSVADAWDFTGPFGATISLATISQWRFITDPRRLHITYSTFSYSPSRFTACIKPSYLDDVQPPQTTQEPPQTTSEPPQITAEPPPAGNSGNRYRLDSVSSHYNLQPGQSFRPEVRICVNQGQLLNSRGDMLLNADRNTYGAHPHVMVQGTVNAGGCYTFVFYADDPMIAPMSEGTYESRWQLYVSEQWMPGTEAVIRFSVGNGGSSGETPNQVALFDDPGWQGERRNFNVGRHNMGDWNDRAHSLRVPAGMSVMLYEHSDYQGQSMCFNSDTHSLPSPYMEGVSSLVVYNNGNCSDGGGGTPVHPALAPSCGAVILRDTSGNELRLSASVSSLSELSWNDRNMVIAVEGPFSAVAYDDFGFIGHQHGPISSGQSQGVGSNVSSVQVTQTSSCDSVPPAPNTSCAVAILRDGSGNELRLTQSVSNLSQLGWNDRNLVITVEGPLSVTTFDDAAYLGFPHGPINTGQSQGVGSNVSSVQLTFTGSCDPAPIDNWCYPGQPWGDGRCNNPDSAIQDYTWNLGWYMYRLGQGSMTCADIPSQYIPNPLCPSPSTGSGSSGGGSTSTPAPTPIFTPTATPIPAECTALNPGVYLVDSGGSEIRFTSSDNNLADNGWNDRAVTIRVVGPYRAWVYDSEDFMGYTRGPYLHGYVEPIGNNVSSVQVEIAIVCP